MDKDCAIVKENVTPPLLIDKGIKGIEPFLSRKELAQVLSVNPQTVANWVCYKRGFPVHRFGTANRYRVSEVLAFFEGED